MNKPEQPNYVVVFFAFAFWVFCAVILAKVVAENKFSKENIFPLIGHGVFCAYSIWWVAQEIKKWKDWRKYIKSRMGYKK